MVRLAENGVDSSLLEAGSAEPPPAIADPAAWFTLPGTSVDWAFETVASRIAVGVLGAVALAAFAVIRRRWWSWPGWAGLPPDGL